MNFETIVEKLFTAVEGADRITARNASLPVLNNILLITTPKSIKIRATNLSLGVEFEVPVKTATEGVLAVDGKTLASFLNTLPKNDPIKGSLVGQTLSLVSNKSKTTIKTYPYEDFPTLPTVSGVSVKIPKNEFIKGVKNTSFSAAVSDIKPEISSVYITADKNTLIFAATDSFRLAEKREDLSKSTDFSPTLIPYKNITEVARIFEGINEEVTITSSENQITFTAPGVYITSRVVSGTFPDYKQIIPKSFTTEVVVLKQDIINILKAANIFSDKFNQINFVIEPVKKKFECSAKNIDIGEYSGNIEAALSGDDVSIALNHRYIMEALSIIPQDSVVFGFNGQNKAVVLRGVSDASFTYLLMPMNR